MSLADIMLDQLAVARRTVEDGDEVVPVWRIATPDASFLIHTRFEEDLPEQRESVLRLIARFMAWKMATSFVLTFQEWRAPEPSWAAGDALVAVGVSRDQHLGLVQRIQRGASAAHFEAAKRLNHEEIEKYSTLLPGGVTTLSATDIAELELMFGEEGDMHAELLS